MLLVGIEGDLGDVFATTCSSIIIEKCTGRLIGPIKESKGGQVVLPEGKSISTSEPTGDGNIHNGLPTPAARSKVDTKQLPKLHQAVYGGHYNPTAQLVKQGEGGDVRVQGPNGWTPLHMAAIGGHKQMSEFLLSKGADIHVRDDQGLTAAQVATQYGHNRLATFLRKVAGSRPRR